MRTPILNLLSNISEESEKKLSQHKELRAAGWKKTGEHEGHHVYTHADHTGHEIHVHPKLHTFTHLVNYGPEHKQKGKHAKGMSSIGLHLDAHSRHTQYDADARKHREADNRGWDAGRNGMSSAPNPRGPLG